MPGSLIQQSFLLPYNRVLHGENFWGFMDPKFWLLATSLLKSVLSKDVANSQHFPLPHMPMEMDQKYQLIGWILAVFCILYVQYSYWHIPNAITK